MDINNLFGTWGLDRFWFTDDAGVEVDPLGRTVRCNVQPISKLGRRKTTTTGKYREWRITPTNIRSDLDGRKNA